MSSAGASASTTNCVGAIGLAVPIEVRYDELTPDIPANRLIKAAERRLASLPLRSSESRRLLSVMRAVFVNVEDAEYRHSELPDLPVNPLNAHYQPALALARLILRAGGCRVGGGRGTRGVVPDRHE